MFSMASFATVRTVSNDPKAPAQYNSINTAIQASSNGDTILVYGSGIGYGNITIDREIVLIGAGYKNPYGGNTSLQYLNLNGAGALSASNSKISGFSITYVYFNGTNGNSKLIEGVLIERCHIYYLEFDDGGVTYRNDTIRNCRFWNYGLYLNRGTLHNIQIHNNLFENHEVGNSVATRTHDSVYVRNCVFINRSTSNVFRNALEMTVENCIFYAAEPQGCTNCAFNNNMTYLNTNNDLDGSAGNPGSVGSGNHINVDPQFVNYPPGGGPYSYSHDLNVQNSNAVNGGTDATDMGIHGGMLPFTVGANPGIPQMTEISFPGNASSVKVGGTLDVTFKAKKQD
jgi:hypothetical protein